MARSTAEILKDIEAFRPKDDIWLPLDPLLFELWKAGVTLADLPKLFAVFERFPDDDGAGVLWSIVHGIESLDLDYEPALRASLKRKESEMGRVMLKRLNNSKKKGKKK